LGAWKRAETSRKDADDKFNCCGSLKPITFVCFVFIKLQHDLPTLRKKKEGAEKVTVVSGAALALLKSK
jgi:hypothetical protein